MYVFRKSLKNMRTDCSKIVCPCATWSPELNLNVAQNILLTESRAIYVRYLNIGLRSWQGRTNQNVLIYL